MTALHGTEALAVWLAEEMIDAYRYDELVTMDDSTAADMFRSMLVRAFSPLQASASSPDRMPALRRYLDVLLHELLPALRDLAKEVPAPNRDREQVIYRHVVTVVRGLCL